MALQRLYQSDKSFSAELDKLLHDEKYVDKLLGLPEDELIQVVNYLSDTVKRFNRIGVPSRKCLHVLRKICGTRRFLPATYGVSGTLSFSEKNVVGHGGYCDAYKGSLSAEICVKRLRMYVISNPDMIKESFCKEATVWKCLDHPNIVAFKGVTLDPLQLVSEWMSGGELQKYLKKHPDADLISLLLGIADGLTYLHSCDVVHGDFKGPNILVDGSGNARIMDFGLASIVRDPSSVASTSDGHGYSPRWTAPEVLRGAPASKKSDVFSFAMVAYEVFAGKPPYYDVTSQVAMVNIMDGKRPGRPVHPNLTDSLWKLTERCWAAKADRRPEMEEVIKTLKEITSRTPSEPPVITKQLSRVISRTPSTRSQKRSRDGGEEATPYDVENPPPVPTMPLQSKAEENYRGHPEMEAIDTFKGINTRNLPSPGDSPTVKRKPSKAISRQPSTRDRSRDGGEEATPYVENPPVPTLATQLKVDENRRLIQKGVSPVGGGTTDGSSSRIPRWSGAGDIDSPAIVKREPSKKEKDARELKEPEEKRRKGGGRDEKRKVAEEPTTTTNETAARTRGPADDPRNFDPATGRGQGQMTGRYPAPSQLPGSTSTTRVNAPSAPQRQQEVSTAPRRPETSTTPQQEKKGKPESSGCCCCIQ